MGLFCTILRSIFGPIKSRMLLMPYLIMVGRSSDRPQAMTFTFSGNPIGRNISGRNIPELPTWNVNKDTQFNWSWTFYFYILIDRTSIHFFKPGWKQNISMLGSVYGLYAGLNSSWVIPNFLKNSAITPMRSPNVKLRSATTPSTWWNSAKCVASSVSLRNTRSILKYLAGVKPPSWFASLYNMRALTAVVWVRSRFFWASSNFQSYLKRIYAFRNKTVSLVFYMKIIRIVR